MEKELAWFEDTARKLEELSNISLDPDVICSQLYDQKVELRTAADSIFMFRLRKVPVSAMRHRVEKKPSITSLCE